MSNTYIKILSATLIMVAMLVFSSSVCGASIGVSVGYSTITVGGSTTLTISGNDAIGKVSVYSSDPNVVSVSTSSLWLEGSANVTLTTKSVGSATITVSAVDMSDSSGNAFSGSRSVGITVKPVYIDTRSTNNNLSSLSLGNDLKLLEEFSKDRVWYGVPVSYEVSKIDVIATPEDPSATISITGNDNIPVGESFITVKVTAENGAEKDYNIKVARDKDPNDVNANLKSLEFEGSALRNNFDKEQYYYMLEDIYSDVNNIKVRAIPEIEEAKVEISGDRNLKIGLNVIEIVVTSRDESKSKTYRVEVFKKDEVLSLVDTEETTSSGFMDIIKENWKLIILLALVILELIIIVILLFKKKKGSPKGDLAIVNDKEKETENTDFTYTLKIESEMNEDTLKYNDTEKNENSRRHRRNVN